MKGEQKRVSGCAAGKTCLLALKSFVAMRQMLGDWSQWMNSKGNALSRKQIAAECKFCRSVIQQNPNVRKLMHRTEAKLRSQGVLKPEATQVQPGSFDTHENREAAIKDLKAKIETLAGLLNNFMRAIQDVEADRLRLVIGGSDEKCTKQP